MSRAVKMLLEKGWITEQQYERAVVLSTRYGETPGYHLVSDGAISDEDLVDFFIRHFSLSFWPKSRLKAIPPEIIGMVPTRLAKHLRTIPVNLTGQNLVLGLTDPSLTHAVEEVSFHTQRLITPVIVSESDMTWALARYYDIHPNRPAARYAAGQAARLSGTAGSPAASRVAKDAAPPRVVAKVQVSPDTGWGVDEWGLESTGDIATMDRRAADSAIPLSEAAPSEKPTRVQKNHVPFVDFPSEYPTLPPPTAVPPSSAPPIRRSIASMMQGMTPTAVPAAGSARGVSRPSTNDIRLPKEIIYEYRSVDDIPQQSIADIVDAIKKADRRDFIISCALDYMLLFAKRAAFLTVRRDEIRGFDIKGEHTHRDAIKSYWIPASADSTFRKTIDDRQIHLGPLLRSTSDAVFAAALGGRPRRVVIIPIEIKNRVAGLLYADKLKIEMPPWNLLERLADVVGSALLRLILARGRP